MAGRPCSALLLALLVAGCTWGKFDDAEDNAPVVSLKKPGDLGAGFGVSLASASAGSGVRLLVGGPAAISPAATYDLSRLGEPGLDAVDSGHCGRDDRCFLAARPAGLATLAFAEEPRELCFALGLHESGAGARGALLRCSDGTGFTLAVPAPVEERLAAELAAGNGGSLLAVFASDDRPVPTLAAASVDAKFAWLYPAGTADVRELMPGGEDSSYGEQVAVLNTALGGVIAVSAPDQGHVWLFREDAQPIGCLSGAPGFGRTLAAGIVNADAEGDLVVADANNVSVFDGARLSALPVGTTGECAAASLPESALIASFGCGSTRDVGGCPGGFGSALAVGDLDGDGDGEVAVGGPELRVRGQSRAGAVLIYDVEPEAPAELAEALFIASAESGDRLGTSLALPRIDETSVVAAGAPGAGKTLLFYCSTLTPGPLSAGRCR